jgi:hypothetical protein
MPHRGASSFAEQTSPGSACPAWQKCQQKQHSFFACVYRLSTTTKQLSTVSANEEKKCLVKSGKVTISGIPVKSQAVGEKSQAVGEKSQAVGKKSHGLGFWWEKLFIYKFG